VEGTKSSQKIHLSGHSIPSGPGQQTKQLLEFLEIYFRLLQPLN